jgi:hypothetical protein
MNPIFDGTQDPARIGQAFMDIIAKAMYGDNAAMIQKTQTVGAPVGPYIYGPGGLFGVRGLEQDIISTHTQISGSLGEMLPIVGSVDTNPLAAYITGFLRSDQQEKNAVCDNPVQAGNMKTGILTTVFGRKEFKTRQAEINRIGQRINRGEFHDLNILNGPLVDGMAGLMSGFFGLQNQSAILAGREMVARLVEVGVAYQRWFCPQIFIGNPANSSAGGGYTEFPGLDLLISRTKVDALSGTALPSLYSTIIDFQYKQVSATADPNIVRVLVNMYHYLQDKANRQDLGPVDLRFVMRGPLFYELTRYWACQYWTDACASANTAMSLNVDARGQSEFRDDMRLNKYLLIDGVRVPVIIDDCIYEDNNSVNGTIPLGGFGSDIYLVPFSARGGTIRTLFWEYYDYRNDVIPVVNDARAGTFFWSDAGVFLWSLKAPDNWCIELISKVEPRLRLRTPQLAGRLTNVSYVPFIHTDDPLPSEYYFLNGGVSTGRPMASPYSEWNLQGPGMGA